MQLSPRFGTRLACLAVLVRRSGFLFSIKFRQTLLPVRTASPFMPQFDTFQPSRSSVQHRFSGYLEPKYDLGSKPYVSESPKLSRFTLLPTRESTTNRPSSLQQKFHFGYITHIESQAITNRRNISCTGVSFSIRFLLTRKDVPQEITQRKARKCPFNCSRSILILFLFP